MPLPRREVEREPAKTAQFDAWDLPQTPTADSPRSPFAEPAAPFPAEHTSPMGYGAEALSGSSAEFTQPWHEAVPPAAQPVAAQAPIAEPADQIDDHPVSLANPFSSYVEQPHAEAEPVAARSQWEQPESPAAEHRNEGAPFMHDDTRDDTELAFGIGRRLNEIASEVAALAGAVAEIERRQQQREQAVNNVLSQIAVLTGQLHAAAQPEAAPERSDAAWPDAAPARAATSHFAA